MKLYRAIIFSFILIGAFSFAQPLQSLAQAPPPAPVVVDKVREETLQKPVTLVGEVEPDKRSIIASEIQGLVESLPGEEGKFVNKGDVLAKFNTQSIEIDLNEAFPIGAEVIFNLYTYIRKFSDVIPWGWY